MNRRSWSPKKTFVVATVLALVVALPSLALSANYRSYPASSCVWDPTITGAIGWNSTWNLANWSTTNVAEVICPLVSDTAINLGSTTNGPTLAIAGHAMGNSGEMQFAACVTYHTFASNIAGECGTLETSGTTAGDFVYNFEVDPGFRTRG